MTRRTGPTSEVAELVKARVGGMCLRCLERRGEQIHHRRPRAMGGSRDEATNQPPNLVWLCEKCHRDIESHRTLAYRSGWLVRQSARPAGQYLVDLDDTMLMLLEDGSVEATPAPVATGEWVQVPF